MPVTFLACCVVVVLWAVSGPIFGFSDTWQLIINTGTTIITFLMVFLIQNTQNRDGAAIQAKLDELIRAGHAENTFIGIEHLTEEEVAEFRERCENAAREHGVVVEVEEKKRKTSSGGKKLAAKKSAAGSARNKSSSGKSKAGAA
jgi:low affinity Fe/Cu permease